MKKKVMIFLSFFTIANWQYYNAAAVSVVVPKQCLVEKASLVLYMLDDLGHQQVGTCRLNEDFATRTILSQDVQIKAQESIDQIANSIDVTHTSRVCDNEIVLHIEFNTEMHVVRVLVVKDNLLADDPFNVFSIPVGDLSEVDDHDEFDSLTALVEDVDTKNYDKGRSLSHNSLLTQYSLYAKIFVMMQYKYAQRKMKDFATWLYRKK